MYTFYFEKLEVWQESKRLMKMVYKMVSGFPKDEKYGLVDQLKRASISVVTNIAEGSARKTGRDQAHFSTMAYGSLMEVLSLLIVANELDLLSSEQLIESRTLIERIANKLNSLRKAQLKSNP